MAQQAGIYAATAVGVIALLAVGAGILYRKHSQDKMEQMAREQVIQERMQHVAGMSHEATSDGEWCPRTRLLVCVTN